MLNISKCKYLIFAIVIFSAAIAPFWLNLNDSFLSDDWDFLTISSGQTKPLSSYLFSNYTGGHDGGSYRPLVNFFWTFNYKLFGLRPFGYHLINILLNAANALLIFGIILLLPWLKDGQTRFAAAVIAALFFTVLPNHAEPVIWISAANDALMAFFYLASLLFLLLARGAPGRFNYIYYAISLMSFFASLLTKEMAITLPLAVALFVVSHSYHLQSPERKKNIMAIVPYFILLIFYFWLRYRAIGLFFGYYGEEHLKLSFLKIYQSYLSIILSNMVSGNARTIITAWFFNHPYSVLGPLAAIIIFLLIYSIKKRRGLLLWLIAAAWMISIIPVMPFGINVTPHYFSDEGERYAYLPSLFFVIFLALMIVYLWRLAAKKQILAVILTGLISTAFVSLAGQLLVKNARWHHASLVAKKSLTSAMQIMKQQNSSAWLFFGLPDNEHGAYIFRNGWQQALAFYLSAQPVVLQPFNRSLVDDNQKFNAEKPRVRRFRYYAANSRRLITARPIFTSLDYNTILEDAIYDNNGLDLRNFGSGLLIDISDNLAKNNIGYLFWNGDKWLLMKL